MNEIRDGYPYFNPSFGNRPLHIVGREKELSLLRTGLAGAPATELRAPIIIGQRSFGKTAMLIEAEHGSKPWLCMRKRRRKPLDAAKHS